jgi:methyltransferase family protein
MSDLKSIFASIGIDKDYSDIDLSDLKKDTQGWRSDHPVFETVFDRYKPKLVVEVGTWKGASVLHMDTLAKQRGLDTEFICVDTWLGSNDTLWLTPHFRESLQLKHGYPSMFRQFLFNMIKFGAIDRIFPLPMTSSAAYYTLKNLGIRPDAIYIDAGHEDEEVTIDLQLYYDLLAPGGVMFGDDYTARWIGVCKAVNRFGAEKGLVLETGAGKWLFEKRAEAPADDGETFGGFKRHKRKVARLDEPAGAETEAAPARLETSDAE